MTSIYFQSTCQEFLAAARQGNVEEAEKALDEIPKSKWNHVINLPGDTKTTKSWSALQLSSYFGHMKMVKFLISHGAEIDYQNDKANTALHLAAFTKRSEIVLELLTSGASVQIVNNEGKTPKLMADNMDESYKLIQQAEKCFMIGQQEKLFKAVRENNADKIIDILNGEFPPSINCKDISGNTPLHIAANLNKNEAAVILLQNGANPAAVNNYNLKPNDLTMRHSMKRLLGLKPVQKVVKDVQRFEGEVLKKGMFLVKRYWVVLSRGIAAFYNRKEDSANSLNRKGYIFLRGASVKIDSPNYNLLVIKLQDRSKQYWSISSGVDRTADTALRQKWLTALQIHIDYAGRMYHKASEFDAASYAAYQKKGSKPKLNWTVGANEKVFPISSVRDSLLSSQSLVKMLSSQVSEVVATAAALEMNCEKHPPVNPDSPVMIPELEELIECDISSGMQSNLSNGYTTYSTSTSPGPSHILNHGSGLDSIPEPAVCNGRLKKNRGLTCESVNLLRQLGDVSEMSRKVVASLEQCMLVMYQQEEYRLEQLNEANRKNEILENALRILAKQQHNLEVTLNESFRSVDSRVINRIEKAVTRRNNSALATTTVSSGMTTTTVDIERSPSRSASFEELPGVNGEAKIQDEEDDDLFFDAISINSNGSVVSAASEFHFDDQARLSPDITDLNGDSQFSENGTDRNIQRTSSPTPNCIPSLNAPIGAAFSHPSKLFSLFTEHLDESTIWYNSETVQNYQRLLVGDTRQRLPVEMPKGRLLSLWETLKELLGKDLTRVSMPVLFNEPLSMLQRSAEFLESAFLLAKASNAPSEMSRMVLTSTFVIINLHSLVDRLNKPFNPLLGETFEFEDKDLGYRFVAEQVSHHPPIAAFNFQSSFCEFNCNSAPMISFGGLGQSIQVRVAGNSVFRLKVAETGNEEVFSWTHAKYIVHNIIAGQLWVEQNGNVTVKNHTNGCSVDIEFKHAGFFKGAMHQVEAFVKDSNGIKQFFLFGKWTESIFSIPVHKMMKVMEDKKRNESLHQSLMADDDCIMVWERLKKDDTSKYYSYTQLAFALNDLKSLSEDQISSLPPTDSRFRPDVRHLENGELSKASEEKHRLEQKQRAARSTREKSKQVWKPLWFEDQHFGLDSLLTGTRDDKFLNSTSSIDSEPSQRFVFNNSYWERDFKHCPDIY